MPQSTQADASARPGDSEHTEVPLREAAANVFASARRQLAELLELFTLEIRYSGLMLGSAAASALMAALAMFSIWGLLLAAITSWLLASGWSWTAILTLLVLANAGLAFGSLWLMRYSLRRVGIDSTRQALGLGVSNVSE